MNGGGGGVSQRKSFVYNNDRASMGFFYTHYVGYCQNIQQPTKAKLN